MKTLVLSDEKNPEIETAFSLIEKGGKKKIKVAFYHGIIAEKVMLFSFDEAKKIEDFLSGVLEAVPQK
ncbi:MAG: hypothetical protein WC933_00680 [Candidatus Paceibacterota bacterium]|jgi:hypothetical protein